MISSLRRITTSTLVIGLLALSFVTAHQAVLFCASGQDSCLVAAVTFGLVEEGLSPVVSSMEQAVSTPDTAVGTPSMLAVTFDLIQVVSVYLILFSVVSILILEIFELRYLKLLYGRKKTI